MSEIKHTPLPWRMSFEEDEKKWYILTSAGSEICQIARKVTEVKGDEMHNPTSQNADLIVEACNNYYKLKEQNEKLKEALIGIKSHIDFCSDEAWSDSLQSSGDYKVMSETLKSCES